MSQLPAPTRFAPAERDQQADIQRQAGRLAAVAMLRQLVDAVPEVLLILNGKRQVVFANRRLLELLPQRREAEIYGARPGELLGCVRAGEEPGGCGTSEACPHCGLVCAILKSLQGESHAAEARLVRDEGRGTVYRVSASPVEIDGRRYVMLCLADVSQEKRREGLEKQLLGGLLEKAHSVRQTASEVQDGSIKELEWFRDSAEELSQAAIGDINGYRILAAAESGQLRPSGQAVDVRDLLQQVADAHKGRREARGKVLRPVRMGTECVVYTDPVLLRYVLGALVLNAVEASVAGDTVTLRYESAGTRVELSVTSPAPMPENVRLQVFQRGFTTREQGRGLGLFAARLLVERYLKGTLSFTSSLAGTTFRISLPETI